MSEKLKAAAQQALTAMDYMLHYGEWYQAQERAEALRAALAEPEPVQEPVAWMVYTADGKSVCVTDHPADFVQWRSLPLYTAPPQRPSLTDEEIDMLKGEVWGSSGIAPRLASAFARAVERAVRGEKE